MWIAKVITHGLLAFILLCAITHHVVIVWAQVRAGAANFVSRFRAVGSANYANAIIVLYLVTASLGAFIYTNYRITARLTLEQGHYWKSFGAFGDQGTPHRHRLGAAARLLVLLAAAARRKRCHDAKTTHRAIGLHRLVGVSRRTYRQQYPWIGHMSSSSMKDFAAFSRFRHHLRRGLCRGLLCRALQ